MRVPRLHRCGPGLGLRCSHTPTADGCVQSLRPQRLAGIGQGSSRPLQVGLSLWQLASSKPARESRSRCKLQLYKTESEERQPLVLLYSVGDRQDTGPAPIQGAEIQATVNTRSREPAASQSKIQRARAFLQTPEAGLGGESGPAVPWPWAGPGLPDALIAGDTSLATASAGTPRWAHPPQGAQPSGDPPPQLHSQHGPCVRPVSLLGTWEKGGCRRVLTSAPLWFGEHGDFKWCHTRLQVFVPGHTKGQSVGAFTPH